MTSTPEEGAPRPLATFAVHGGARGELPVLQTVVSIGNGGENDMKIDDDSVSTTHAQLEYVRGAWRIVDLESTNGTFVEGIRLAPHVPTPLHYGSTVRFGGVQTHFRPVAGADPESAPVQRSPSTARRSSAPKFRLPVWVVAFVVLLAVIAFAWFAWVATAPDPDPNPTVVDDLGAQIEYVPDAIA
jgi:predicted component of type VI protein secretion system